MSVSRRWAPALALAVLVIAAAVSFGWPKRNGLDFNLDGSGRALAADRSAPHVLTDLAVLRPVLRSVKDGYVDPSRVDYQKMLFAGLNAIQRNVAPVLVDYREGADTFTVRVRQHKKKFPANLVEKGEPGPGPWDLSARFEEVFAFLQKHLQGEADLELRDVEYAAINGMLHTLDPHTTLLTPDIFEEMRTSTRGEFGGLGIVISIREGHLTVIRPIEGTPAFKAGLKRRDRIVKINDESTLNMPLSEAVNRLRGKPGSKVTVYVSRKLSSNSWGKPKRVQLTRAVIRIDSVESRMLKDRVGYVKVNNFQGNTSDDLVAVLRKLRARNMRGLVLDLRGNPGGLLEQAVRMSDLFVSAGPIVTTSSRDPMQRDEKFARAQGTQPNYPMVVLINGASASASEIVAGALKNHDRAIIVGQQSFGKGSVQVLQDNLKGGAALKITVAQYLTPGDVSIQGVGIVPDIAIDPMTVDKEDVDLQADEVFLRESDLRSHLTHESATNGQRPKTVLRYYLSSDLRQRLAEAEPNEEENKDEENFLIEFSRKVIARASTGDRRAMLAEADRTIGAIAAQELKKAEAQLKKFGVDWSTGADQGATTLKVTASTEPKVSRSGQPLSLTVEVTNTGDKPVYQLRATTESDYRLFDKRELVFGKVVPGQTRRWSTTLGVCTVEDDKRRCRLPRSTPARADIIKVVFAEAHGHAPSPVEVRTAVERLDPPQFAFSYTLPGHGGGIDKGKRIPVKVDIKNVGAGPTHKAQANLRNLSGRGVLLHDGRFPLETLKPGQTRSVTFSFEVLADFSDPQAELEIAIVDPELRAYATHKFTVPVGASQTPSTDVGVTQDAPRIKLDFDGRRVTREDNVRIKGRAIDTSRVRDMYIFAGGRKVHYQANDGDDKVLKFDTEVPLHGGLNYITVVARQDEELVARELLVIRRDAPDGSAMPTPEYDDEAWIDPEFGPGTAQPPH